MKIGKNDRITNTQTRDNTKKDNFRPGQRSNPGPQRWMDTIKTGMQGTQPLTFSMANFHET